MKKIYFRKYFHFSYKHLVARTLKRKTVFSAMLGEQYKTLCLYYTPESAPCRHVMLTAKVLRLDLNLMHVDLTKGEQFKRSYLQINPLHNVPLLTDNLFSITESRAIMTYLADKYAKDESLYPRDLQKRAKVNQFLFFDMQTLLAPMSAYIIPVLTEGKPLDESKMADIEKAFKFLDTALHESEYLVGLNLTLADLAVVSSVASAVLCIDFKLEPYGNVDKWYKHLKSTLPDFEETIENNCRKFRVLIDYMKNKI